MVPFLNPKLLKQQKTELEQYPLAPTSTANRSTLQPLFSTTLFSGKYLLTLVLCQASIFSLYGHVSSMRITLFSFLEKIIISGLSSENAMWGGKEKVPSRSPNNTQSDAWCNIPLGEEFLFFSLLSFFYKFYFYGLLWSRNWRFDVFNWRSSIANDNSQDIVMTESESPLT